MPKQPNRDTAIVAVDDDVEALRTIETALRRRFGADYEIVAETSPERALERCGNLRDSGVQVAILLADQWLAGSTGIDFLDRAHSLCPAAMRGLLLTWGDRSATDQIIKASGLGRLDNYLTKPWGERDERFHRDVSELLEEWARLNGPRFEAIKIVGEQWSEWSHGLRDGLQRNAIPFGFYEHDSAAGRALLAAAGISGPLPVVIFPDGTAIAQPTAIDIANTLGVNAQPGGQLQDVVIIGAGPAGLAAAVYGASEGLRTLVLETEAIGGQAGTSSRIRNYLGFPRGLTGTELAERAYNQAWFFGAQFLIGRTATGLRVDGVDRVVLLDDGSQVRTRTVVLATGVTYRRIGIESVEALIGRGVYYGAAITEAPAMTGEPVFVVGGANSAGQAAVYLARYAARVTILIRGNAISEMSEYLIEEIKGLPNADIRLNTQIVEAKGDHRLRSLVLADAATGTTEEVAATAAFIMIGAAPRTEWLPADVRRDARGFVLTGAAAGSPTGAGARAPSGLETSLAGVFATGDVRSGSVKRVAAAVGEGSTTIREAHDYLASLANAASLKG